MLNNRNRVYPLILFLVFLIILSPDSSGQIKENYLIYSSLKGNLGNSIPGFAQFYPFLQHFKIIDLWLGFICLSPEY